MQDIRAEQYALDLVAAKYSEDAKYVYSLFYDTFTNIFPHQMMEVKIDGKWFSADPVLPSGVTCFLGYPISRLGDDPDKTWAAKYTGSPFYIDSYPFVIIGMINFLFMMRPTACRMTSESFREADIKGRKMLEQMGGIEKYNEKFEKGYERRTEELSSLMDRLMESDGT